LDPESHFGLALLSPRPFEQVRQPDARTLESVPDKGNVVFEIRDIHDDYLPVLALRERLVPPADGRTFG